MKIRAILTALPVLIACSFPAVFAQEIAPVRTISVRECVEIALKNNIDIAVAKAEKEIGEAGVPIEEAAFLPKFTGDLSASRSIAPSGSALDGSLSLDQEVYKFNLGVKDLLPTGTALSLDFANQRQESSTSIALLSPQYNSGLTLSAQQPLLKNRGRTVTEAPLKIARAGAAAKTEDWKAKVMDIVAAARSAFFSFTSALQEVEVRKSALELADRLLVYTDARIESGSAAPLDKLPAEAVVASRKEELIRAEAAAQGAEDDLKTILGLRSPGEWDARLIPVTVQEEISLPTIEETVDEAMRRRPEAVAQSERRKQAEIQEAVGRNRTLPSLDLTVSGGLSGLSGTPNPNPLFPAPVSAFTGGYGESLDQMFSGKYYNWFVGLKTELPWRFDREKAEWARSRSALGQQRLLEEGLSLKIRSEVRKARRDLESALLRIAAARASAAAAAKKLEAEEEKLSLGRSTTIEVLRFQQDKSEALLSEVRAMADARLAQIRLRRAVGTILEREGITIK
jgi:outer membrane protein TolC